MPIVLQRFIHSRKFWVFITALVGLISASYQNDGVFTASEIETMVYLAIGYGASIALEDGLTARAVATATTTTVSTPGESNVTVTAPPETTPQSPMLGRMGG